MSELVKDIQNGELCNEDSNLANACIEAIRFYRAENRLEIVLKTDSILSMDSYLYFTDNVVQDTNIMVTARKDAQHILQNQYNPEYAAILEYASQKSTAYTD